MRKGGVARAAARLFLTQLAISKQIHFLEESIGEKQLIRNGRRLELTEPGRTVIHYPDEIVTLGSETRNSLKMRLHCGV